MKKSYLILCAGLILFVLVGISLAEDETKVITTYYPSPLGIYNNLKLFPHHAQPSCDNSTLNNEGMFFYNDDPDAAVGPKGLYFCTENSSADLEWQLLEGGGYWTLGDLDEDGTNDILYTNDSDSSEDWNVGIGTATPLAKLHIEDSEAGSVLVNCSDVEPGNCAGTTPVNPDDGSQLGLGTRLMWIPNKGAFRAGAVTGTQWNNANIGRHSFATGLDTTAMNYSATEGWSVAMGHNTVATAPLGEAASSVAFGYDTYSNGSRSLAMGWGTCATGDDAVAMGIGVLDLNEDPTWSRCAAGDSSITMGRECQATGMASWAVGDYSSAEGRASIAWGYRARAAHDHSMAVGLDGTISAPNFCETDNPYQFKICGDLHVDTLIDPPVVSINAVSANVNTVEACNKYFQISHPDPDKPAGALLRHASIETPTAGDNLYRWVIKVENQTAVIKLPDYYKYLNKDDMVWVAPVEHFGRGYGEIDENQEKLTIYADSDGEYNVVLIATRKDEYATKYWQGPEVYIEPDS